MATKLEKDSRNKNDNEILQFSSGVFSVHSAVENTWSIHNKSNICTRAIQLFDCVHITCKCQVK